MTDSTAQAARQERAREGAREDLTAFHGRVLASDYPRDRLARLAEARIFAFGYLKAAVREHQDDATLAATARGLIDGLDAVKATEDAPAAVTA